MDYQKARQVRKRSLLSLITEQKFGEGKSLTASIRGAASQKFKAKATGIKESLDPLNWVRKATGKGAFGDFAVTGLGRMFGRSDKDIKAFGGIGRKKIKGKKNPQFTTIAAGPIKPLKRGDGVADVLAKMYNFMMQNEEMHKLNLEIDKTFKQEEMDEDDRRHKELVDTIKKYMKVPKSKDVSKSGDAGGFGFFDGIIDMVKGLIGKAIDALKFLIAPLLTFVSSIGAMALEALGTLAAFLITPVGVAFLGLIAAGTIAAWIAKMIAADPQAALAGKGPVGTAVAGPGAETQLPSSEEEQANKSLANKAKAVDKKGIKKASLEELEAKQQLLIETGDPRYRVKKGQGDESDKLKAKQLDDVESEITARKSKQTSQAPNNKTETPTAVPVKSASSEPTPEKMDVPVPTAATETPKVQPVEQSANPPVPVAAPSQASTGGDNQPIVSVNSSTNTIGDKSPPKIVQTNTARARNNDLDRYLMAISVPV
jgi:hypothetical protein